MVDRREWIAAGVDHFNRLEFFEAHEAWEHIWLEESGEKAIFVQGLIQLAAAYLHIRRGTSLRGALRLLNMALEKLEPYAPGYCGVDRERVIAAATCHRASLVATGAVAIADDEYPRLSIVAESV